MLPKPDTGKGYRLVIYFPQMCYVNWTEKSYKKSFLRLSFKSNTVMIITHEKLVREVSVKTNSIEKLNILDTFLDERGKILIS